VEVYSGAAWYRKRTEPEKTWRGVLRELRPAVGPSGRASLRYALATEGRSLPVYAANVERRLRRFLGRKVVVRGKLIDLSGEGFGEELWIGSIRTAGR
jgi:hypothetical protein